MIHFRSSLGAARMVMAANTGAPLTVAVNSTASLKHEAW